MPRSIVWEAREENDMNLKYHMPTKVIAGPGCVAANAGLFRKCGSRALIMTGKSSAKKSGSLEDVEAALSSQGIEHSLFDRVDSNPGLADCRAAAAAARGFRADFIVGIGGGSPLDAAKAAAILAKNELSDAQVFGGAYPGGALPVVAIPTTAGTGSEVTQYAILTNDSIESKSSISSELIFPVLALLDSAYTATLDHHVAANTAMDALSHAVEGYLSLRSDPWSRALAYEALRVLAKSLPRLARGEGDELLRSELLLAANMAGAVIAQTGTTIVHAMGYSLTYFKGIDHGRANGLLLGPYLELINEAKPEAVREVLEALGCGDLSSYRNLLDSLLGEREGISPEEIRKFAALALKTKHVGYTAAKVGEAEIMGMYEKGLKDR
jgi:alcohol dehydrogenase class IV